MVRWPVWSAGLHCLLACMVRWPALPAGLYGLLAYMVCWPVWSAGLYGLLACMVRWPVWSAGLHGPLAYMVRWPVLTAGIHGPLACIDRWPTLTAGLYGPLACQKLQVPTVKLQPSARPANMSISTAAAFNKIFLSIMVWFGCYGFHAYSPRKAGQAVKTHHLYMRQSRGTRYTLLFAARSRSRKAFRVLYRLRQSAGR
jgi:hypothetical protein